MSCCSTSSPHRLYLAETGLVPPAGGAGLPNHHTPMHVVPRRAHARRRPERAEGARSRSPPVGGVKLVKTYTFQRGDYVIGVRARGRQRLGSAPVSPQLYLQLVRDGNDPPGGSSFYFTFTGPAIYTDSSKFQKIDFKDDREARTGREADHETSRRTAGWRWSSTTSPSAWLVDKPGAPGLAREFFTAKVDANTYSVGDAAAAGRDRARRRPRPSTRASSPARRKRDKLASARARPRAGQGLRLVHDPRQAAVLAADPAAQADRQLGLVDRRRWSCCSRSPSTGSTPRPTARWRR